MVYVRKTAYTHTSTGTKVNMIVSGGLNVLQMRTEMLPWVSKTFNIKLFRDKDVNLKKRAKQNNRNALTDRN